MAIIKLDGSDHWYQPFSTKIPVNTPMFFTDSDGRSGWGTIVDAESLYASEPTGAHYEEIKAFIENSDAE